MKFNILKTRKGRLQNDLEQAFKAKLDVTDITKILTFVDEYEKDNLATIDKLKRSRQVEVNKINGALRQAIDSHGPITKVLIGSATKRVYGALLGPKEIKKVTQWQKIKKWFNQLSIKQKLK